MAPIGTTLLTLVTTQVLLSQITVGHYPHFFPWAKHWKSKEDSSSSSSSSESEESNLPKKACDAWVKQTLDSLHAQVSYLKKKIGTDCRPEALSALCPPGYHYLVGRCYKLSVDKQTWNKARLNCTWDGGDLVAIETPVEEEALDKFITSSKGYKSCKFYTLGNDQEYKGFWLWGTGKSAAAMIYKNWAEGEPNDHGSQREACVEYFPKHGWNDVKCDSQLRYICERPPGYSQDAFNRNVTDAVKSSEESDSSDSSKESSSKSKSAEKHRSYGKRSKDLDYKHGGPPPWWFHHHGRFHHHHPHHGPHHHGPHHHGPHHHGPHHHRGFMKPWHSWHHKHKGSFLSRGHGAHEKHYHGSDGHYSKHKSYRWNGYRGKQDSDEDQSKSKSSSEKNKTKLKTKDSSEESHSKEGKEKKSKDKSSQESSSEENKSRGYYGQYQHYKPWFHHKPWHYGRHYKHHGSSESSSEEKKKSGKVDKSSGKSSEERHISLMYSLLRRVVHGFSDLSVHKALHHHHFASPGPFPVPPVPQQLYPPPYIFIPVIGLGDNITDIDNTNTTHQQGASVGINNDTTVNSTSANMTSTGLNGNTGNEAEVNDTVSETSGRQGSKYKGIYVYSYLPPHRPQRIFYPGLPPSMLGRPLHGNPNTADVHLRWGYYYGGKGKGTATSVGRGGMDTHSEDQVDSVQVKPYPVGDVSTVGVPLVETSTDTTGVSSTPTSQSVPSTDTTSTTVSPSPEP